MAKCRFHMEYVHLTTSADGSHSIHNPTFTEVYEDLLNTTEDSSTIDEFHGKFVSFTQDRDRGQHYLELLTYLQSFNTYTSKLMLQDQYRSKGL